MSKIQNITINQLKNKDDFHNLFNNEVNSEELKYVRKKYNECNIAFTEDKEAYWILKIYKSKILSKKHVDKLWEQIINEMVWLEYSSNGLEIGNDWNRLVYISIIHKNLPPKKFLLAFREIKEKEQKIEENGNQTYGYTKIVGNDISSRNGFVNNIFRLNNKMSPSEKTFLSEEDKRFWKTINDIRKKLNLNYGQKKNTQMT